MWGRGDSNSHARGHMILSPESVPKLFNKMTVSEIAELSNLSKSYISQVKHGKRAPSQKLIESLSQLVKP